ncbi:aldose 1-epimerase family protein [uncultured Rothia sp.]|uniref:aldose 1-epimerase family protein n=1 Tax=uncultured Rothia sp. TaxID=316088 RepID=UPI00321645CA
MNTLIPLYRKHFSREHTVLENCDWTVHAKTYPSGIESLTITGSRGYVEVLPYMGQMIWDAEMDGISLRMKNMFTQPQPATAIQDTYGCFAFHSGLLANGCPSPEDTHALHGEFPCAPMDSAELVLHDDGAIGVRSYREYVKGFGHRYLAVPELTMRPDSGVFSIELEVKNLSSYMPMPLQYMCHMNYAFVPQGVMRDNLPEDSFHLRETVPAHVSPTPEWEEINRDILNGKYDASSLEGAEKFDPEIVYFADDLSAVNRAEFLMNRPDGSAFVTRFDPADFPVTTRWILHNPDQTVAAFALPGTSRPEGYLAAEKTGTLLKLAPGETRRFTVETGLLNPSELKDAS